MAESEVEGVADSTWTAVHNGMRRMVTNTSTFNSLGDFELYGKTGIQIMDFNTVFQLYAMKRDGSSALEAADRIMFIPDALSYMLTGNAVTEYTIASTSGFINPYTKQPDREILESIGISPELFGISCI